MAVTKGKILRPQKVVVYGPEGIGKSTFAAKAPRPVFIDTEGSTYHMDVAREDKPTSWTMLLEQVKGYRKKANDFDTLVIDTADWAENLCVESICAKAKVDGIEGFGYGKGYTYLEEEFGRLLNLLEEVVSGGMNVVVCAHAQMRKFEQPDEIGAYDRWELKLEKKTAALLKEWADAVLFANYKTHVVNVDNQGAQKGKNKAQGGRRVMYTEHHPCWDAKNRFGLLPECDFDFSAIAPYLPAAGSVQIAAPQSVSTLPSFEDVVLPEKTTITESNVSAPTAPTHTSPRTVPEGIPRALADLMAPNNVTEAEIQDVVGERGYYPKDTPIANYEPSFINGVLVGAWDKVYTMIVDRRANKYL